MKDKLTIEVDNTSDFPITINYGDYEERVSFTCDWDTLKATLIRHAGSGLLNAVQAAVEKIRFYGDPEAGQPTDPISQDLIHDGRDDR